MDDRLIEEFEDLVRKISSGAANEIEENRFLKLLQRIERMAADGSSCSMYQLGCLYAIESGGENFRRLLGSSGFKEGEKWLTRCCELGDWRAVDILISLYSGELSEKLRDAAKIVRIECPHLIRGTEHLPVYTPEFTREVYRRVFEHTGESGRGTNSEYRRSRTKEP